MKDYFDEDEYIEDVYGDEIKAGDGYYRVDVGKWKREDVVHEKNIIQFIKDEYGLEKEER